MRRRYTAQLIERDTDGWATKATRSFKPVESAERWLARKLPPIICTRHTYHRDIRRAGWGDVYDSKRCRVVATMQPGATEAFSGSADGGTSPVSADFGSMRADVRHDRNSPVCFHASFLFQFFSAICNAIMCSAQLRRVSSNFFVSTIFTSRLASFSFIDIGIRVFRWPQSDFI